MSGSQKEARSGVTYSYHTGPTYPQFVEGDSAPELFFESAMRHEMVIDSSLHHCCYHHYLQAVGTCAEWKRWNQPTLVPREATQSPSGSADHQSTGMGGSRHSDLKGLDNVPISTIFSIRRDSKVPQHDLLPEWTSETENETRVDFSIVWRASMTIGRLNRLKYFCWIVESESFWIWH